MYLSLEQAGVPATCTQVMMVMFVHPMLSRFNEAVEGFQSLHLWTSIIYMRVSMHNWKPTSLPNLLPALERQF